MCFALKNFLKVTEMTPEVFAASVECSRVAVIRYLSGARIPSKKIMKKIFDVTGGQVTPNDFYELPEKPSQAPSGNGDGLSVFSPVASTSSGAGRGRATAPPARMEHGPYEYDHSQIDMFSAAVSS